MEKYLQQILKEVNTVIIPGLGALTIINENTGEVMFMSYLKYDDGKLTSYIAEKENISLEEAKNLVSTKVENIMNTIDEGVASSLNGMGEFSKDSNGEVYFSNNISVISDEIGDVNVFIPEEKSEIEISEEIPASESVIEDIVNEEPLILEQKISSDIIEEVEMIISEPIVNDVISSTIDETAENEESLDSESNTIDNTIEEKKTSHENVVEEIISEEPLVEDIEIEKEEEIHTPSLVKVRKKRGVGFFILLFLILLLIAGGTAVALNYKNIRQFIPFLSQSTNTKSEENESIQKMEMDTTQPTKINTSDGQQLMTAPEEGEVKKTVVAEIPVNSDELIISKPTKRSEPMDQKQTFYLVVGSFLERKNADRAVDKLVAEGQKDASTVKNNGKFNLTIANYSNIDDAKSGQKSFKGSFPNAWILKL
jgi:cell division protein FtsN